ncbi:hypothetical protein BH23CHL2_BH23CHL2_34110 [soil metagenome]
MFNVQIAMSRTMIRFVVVTVVLIAALPMAGVMAGEKHSRLMVEVEQVDRWEAERGDRVRGSMVIRLQLRDGETVRPLADAEVVFQSATDSDRRQYKAVSNQQGIVLVDSDYNAKDRTRAGIQIVNVFHAAVPKGMGFGESFEFHGDPLPAVFVYDSGNSRIQKLTLDGSFIKSWGQEGSGPGEFCPGLSNADFALDSSSNLYVIDSCNRVQKFNSNGDFLMQWGSEGEAPGEFYQGVHGIFVDDLDQVYVLSRERIQRFDSNGEFQMLISTGNQPTIPTDIGIDPGGDLWVSSYLDYAYEYSATGEYLGSLHLYDTNDNFIIADDGTFYTSSGYRVHKVSADGSTSELWGPVYGGTGMGEFSRPESFALVGDQIYVLERVNNRVQILSTDGDYVGTFGAPGMVNGQFDNPTDIAIHN